MDNVPVRRKSPTKPAETAKPAGTPRFANKPVQASTTQTRQSAKSSQAHDAQKFELELKAQKAHLENIKKAREAKEPLLQEEQLILTEFKVLAKNYEDLTEHFKKNFKEGENLITPKLILLENKINNIKIKIQEKFFLFANQMQKSNVSLLQNTIQELKNLSQELSTLNNEYSEEITKILEIKRSPEIIEATKKCLSQLKTVIEILGKIETERSELESVKQEMGIKLSTDQIVENIEINEKIGGALANLQKVTNLMNEAIDSGKETHLEDLLLFTKIQVTSPLTEASQQLSLFSTKVLPYAYFDQKSDKILQELQAEWGDNLGDKTISNLGNSSGILSESEEAELAETTQAPQEPSTGLLSLPGRLFSYLWSRSTITEQPTEQPAKEPETDIDDIK